MLISIIIATLNRHERLRECLNSIALLDPLIFDKIEIIIVDQSDENFNINYYKDILDLNI